MEKQIIEYWTKYCSEDITKIEGFERWLNDTTDTVYHCHHKLEIELGKTYQELIDENMYYGRPASELIIMTETEHISLHRTGKPLSEETRQKMRESHTGKTFSDEHKRKIGEAMKDKPKSEEHRRKLSEAAKNMSEEHKRKIGESSKGRIHSEETKRKIGETAKGCKWWNNGVTSKLSKTCPGPDFVPGRLRHK